MRDVSMFMLMLGLVNARTLRQSDFDQGTVILDKPGVYTLASDIEFNPFPVSPGESAYQSGGLVPPRLIGRVYDPAAFGIGFFSAISISGPGVTLDLNGFEMTQSKEHALMQRFYAHIELANMPFLPTQGPHTFGTRIIPATDVVVKNGHLGRSSHHGIHGNSNTNVLLQNLTFHDFEVAAIALNQGKNVRMEDIDVLPNRRDVPIMGIWSAGLFLRPYVNHIATREPDFPLTVNGMRETARSIQGSLEASVNTVFDDIVSRNRSFINKHAHPEEFGLFHNREGVVDGNCYGILLNPKGVAVNGFPNGTEVEMMSSNVTMTRVHVRQVKCFTNEIPVLKGRDGAQLDPIGAAFQTYNRHPDTGFELSLSSSSILSARYTGNVVSNAQALVAKAILHGLFRDSPLSTKRNTIDGSTLEWIETSGPMSTLLESVGGYVCNGDVMFHVNKGAIGMKLDGVNGLHVKDCSVADIQNVGPAGSDLCNDNSPYRLKLGKSHPLATLPGYGGAETRGCSFSGSRHVVLENFDLSTVSSHYGASFGLDGVVGFHNLTFKDCSLSKVYSCGALGSPTVYSGNPTRFPASFYLHGRAHVERVSEVEESTPLPRSCPVHEYPTEFHLI